MREGTKVTFRAAVAERLLRQVAFHAPGLAQLKAELAAGFVVTGSPRPGRVNVTIERGGEPSYRTVATADIEVMA